MKTHIRPVSQADAASLHAIRTMSGVRENVYGLPSQRVADSEAFIASLGKNDHLMIAEMNGIVIGCAGLHVNSNPRLTPSAHLGIMVHTGYQGKGIGKELMREVLHIADDFLGLIRVDLDVSADNLRAIKLYQLFGFVIEGTKKYAFIRDGKYHDMYFMARYRAILE